jgi:hypothetical protein
MTTRTHIHIVRGTGKTTGNGCVACARTNEAEERRLAIMRAQEAIFQDHVLPDTCMAAERLPFTQVLSLAA